MSIQKTTSFMALWVFRRISSLAHAREPWWNDENVDVYDRQLHPEKYPKVTDSTIHYGLGTVYDNLTISVGEIKRIPKDSFGFMDMARYESSSL